MESLLYIILIIILSLSYSHPVITVFQCILGCLVKLIKFPKIDLKKKYGDWAVVTGCTDGIGKEYAKELAKRNINLVLISRSLDKLQKTKEEIEKVNSTVECQIIQADLSQGQEVLANVENQLQNIPVAILVNNVGKLNDYPIYLEEYKEKDIWDIVNLNISTLTCMSRIVIASMKSRGKGAIVNISSAASYVPIPLQSIYSASKAYVNFFSDATREEYAKYGLTIQCLTPFYIKTKMVGYSERITNNPLVPDPATYARNAIDTLGKLNSTTGYWLHDIIQFIASLSPKWLVLKVIFLFNRFSRSEYLSEQKKKLRQN